MSPSWVEFDYCEYRIEQVNRSGNRIDQSFNILLQHRMILRNDESGDHLPHFAFSWAWKILFSPVEAAAQVSFALMLKFIDQLYGFLNDFS